MPHFQRHSRHSQASSLPHCSTFLHCFLPHSFMPNVHHWAAGTADLPILDEDGHGQVAACDGSAGWRWSAVNFRTARQRGVAARRSSSLASHPQRRGYHPLRPQRQGHLPPRTHSLIPNQASRPIVCLSHCCAFPLCLYACVSACARARVCASVCACVRVCERESVCACVRVRVCVCTCTCVCMYVCMYVCVCVCVCGN